MDVNTAEHSTVITFSDYHEGSAPALIMNHTQWDVLIYKQRYEKRVNGELDLLLLISPFWETLEFLIVDIYRF